MATKRRYRSGWDKIKHLPHNHPSRIKERARAVARQRRIRDQLGKWPVRRRSAEANRRIKRRYRLRHPDKTKALWQRSYKKFQALPPNHPRQVKHRTRQMLYARQHVAGRYACYGLTVDDYTDLCRAQGDVCAICKRPETTVSKLGKPKQLAVDHCHETGAVRGLLCQACNAGIGLLRDDPVTLSAALHYLQFGQQLT